jgi:PhnB protein
MSNGFTVQPRHFMPASTKPIPDDYRAVTPYLIVKGAAAAIDFYQQAFGATEFMRMPGPGGMIMHAEVRIGSGPVMLADEFPQMGALSPQSVGGSPVFLLAYFEDVDAVFNRAVAAGAKVVRPLQDQFYGDRTGTLADPFGHQWTLATRKEDVSPEEMGRRMAAMGEKGPCPDAAQG